MTVCVGKPEARHIFGNLGNHLNAARACTDDTDAFAAKLDLFFGPTAGHILLAFKCVQALKIRVTGAEISPVAMKQYLAET